MRLINAKTFYLYEFYGVAIPPYAILSHRWDAKEVTFADLQAVQAKRHADPHQSFGELHREFGREYLKLQRLCELAVAAGLHYVWIDTCCIDKTSSTELSEAINSMYNWYERSQVCFVYMNDVVDTKMKTKAEAEQSFVKSRWFTRGWTLQELLAPRNITFLDSRWQSFGTRSTLSDKIQEATGISSVDFYCRHKPVATVMSWAAYRETTKDEDIAYCLFGLFDVNMPLLYGEGAEKAFLRLQAEILSQDDDESLFAWFTDGKKSGLLATSPNDFDGAGDIELPSEGNSIPREPYQITNKGLHMRLRLKPHYPDGPHGVQYWSAPLNCRKEGQPGLLHIYLIQKRGSVDYEFCRVGPLEQIETVAADWTGVEPKDVYIRLKHKYKTSIERGFDGLHNDYVPPKERIGSESPMQEPDSVWQVSGRTTARHSQRDGRRRIGDTRPSPVSTVSEET